MLLYVIGMTGNREIRVWADASVRFAARPSIISITIITIIIIAIIHVDGTEERLLLLLTVTGPCSQRSCRQQRPHVP